MIHDRHSNIEGLPDLFLEERRAPLNEIYALQMVPQDTRGKNLCVFLGPSPFEITTRQRLNDDSSVMSFIKRVNLRWILRHEGIWNFESARLGAD